MLTLLTRYRYLLTVPPLVACFILIGCGGDDSSPLPDPTPTPSVSPSPSPSPSPIASFPQFHPNDSAFTANQGAFVVDRDYWFQSDDATIREGYNGPVVARGTLVTQTFGQERSTVTYAVYVFTGNISVERSAHARVFGSNPVVLLTRSDFTMTNGSIFVSANSNGLIQAADRAGGGFGGVGGGGTMTYGSDFADRTRPHLQGGSAGGNGGAGGNALYIGCSGVLTMTRATIEANGASGAVGGEGGVLSQLGGGGSGGGIALFGGNGVRFEGASIVAKGGSGGTFNELRSGGGGGGRVVIGYGKNTPTPDISFVDVSGASGGLASGSQGVKEVVPFDGF